MLPSKEVSRPSDRDARIKEEPIDSISLGMREHQLCWSFIAHDWIKGCPFKDQHQTFELKPSITGVGPKPASKESILVYAPC